MSETSLMHSPMTNRWYVVTQRNRDGSARKKLDVTDLLDKILEPPAAEIENLKLQLTQAQASLAAARAQALRLTEEFLLYAFGPLDKLPMTAGEFLDAIRSLAPSDSTALAKLLAEERRPWEESLREIMDLVESGALVRDISGDLEPGWAMKQIPLVTALAKAHELLAARVAELKGEQRL